MKHIICIIFGHEWLANGAKALRVKGRWLGETPDWQKCYRCGRWELVR
jgi:hypothetical protein